MTSELFKLADLGCLKRLKIHTLLLFQVIRLLSLPYFQH